MKNKLSQFFINYMKNKKCKTFNQGGVDLTKNDPNDNWSALNPFKYSIRLGGHVMKFIDEKNNKQKGDKWLGEVIGIKILAAIIGNYWEKVKCLTEVNYRKDFTLDFLKQKRFKDFFVLLNKLDDK